MGRCVDVKKDAVGDHGTRMKMVIYSSPTLTLHTEHNHVYQIDIPQLYEIELGMWASV